MIQIYSQKNTNYTVNGDAVLTPSLCEINTDGWQLALEHPLDEEGRWRLIAEGAVLKVPSFLPDGQLFRIFNVLKSDDGVTATAQPIFFDSKDDCLLIDVRPTGKTGQQALDILTAGTKYSGSSDIPGTSTAYYQLKNLMEALTGEDENSFINRWGGEVLYNNYEIVINNRLGADNGVGLLYGKNIPENGMSVETDLSGVVTRIYPKAYNGRMMSGTLYVDSPNINAYPTVKQKVMEFADVRLAEDISGTEDTEGLVVCADQTALNAALRQKCQEQFSAGIDAPAVTIACDMMLLADTANYADLKDLETVSLGDTVHCKNNQLGITTTARVTSLVYDCIRKGVKSVVIGSEPYNYIADTSSTIQAADAVIDKGNNTLLADRIAGIINLMHTSLRAQKDIAEKQDVRAILFEDLDENSPTFGALCIGTQGIQISKQRTPEGTDWVWTTAINFQAVNASVILTGELWANLIKTGRIESKDGTVYFDLDKDELASSKLVDPQGDVYVVVGTDIDMAAEGLFLYKDDAKFAQLYINANHDTELLSKSGIGIRSHGGTNNPTNLIYMDKDTDGNGYVYISRANGSSFVTSLRMGAEGTYLRNPNGISSFQADNDNTVLRNPGNGVIFRGNASVTALYNQNGIETFQSDEENTVLRNPVNGVVLRGNDETTNLYNPAGICAFQADNDNIALRNSLDRVIFRGNYETTDLYNPGNVNTFHSDTNNTILTSPTGNCAIFLENDKIEFTIHGAIVAYVDATGFHNA